MIDQATQTAAQQPQNWMQLVYMAIIVICVNIPLWIREMMKHKDFKAKNGTLAEIKNAADGAKQAADGAKSKVIEVKADVGKLQRGQVKLSRDMAAQVRVCRSISGPLSKKVEDNSKNIVDILKTNG